MRSEHELQRLGPPLSVIGQSPRVQAAFAPSKAAGPLDVAGSLGTAPEVMVRGRGCRSSGERWRS